MNNDWLKESDKVQEPKANDQERVYEVKKGDSLSKIGKALNVKWKDLAKKNDLKSPYVIRIGQKLKY